MPDKNLQNFLMQERVDSVDNTGIDIDPQDLNPSPQKSNSHYLTIDGANHYIPTLINDLLGADKKEGEAAAGDYKAIMSTRYYTSKSLKT